MKNLLLACLAALLPATAHAGTFVVDAQMGAGADFPDVQVALNSTLVVDGDTLLIRPGSYSRVVTSKSVTMKGLGASPDDVNFFKSFVPWEYSEFRDCTGPVRFSNVRFAKIFVYNTTQPVHFVGVRMSHLFVRSAQFVRVENEGLGSLPPFSVDVFEDSNAEFLQCSFLGSYGLEGQDGGIAARVRLNSFARFADCEFEGGPGSNHFYGSLGGTGGVGLHVEDNSRVQLVGKSGNLIRGGYGGWGLTVPEDGDGGVGLAVDVSSFVRRSNYDLIGGVNPGSGLPSAGYEGFAASLTTALVPDPLMTRTGSFAPGATSTFHLLGEPGATAIAFFGLQAKSTPIANIIGDLATNFNGAFLTTQTDATGNFNFDVLMPLDMPIGTLATMQSGMVYLSDGSARLSNPATVWVQ